MSCGGYGSPGGLSSACYNWNPALGTFVHDSDLTKGRYAHILEQMVDINDTSSSGPVPMALGYLTESDAYISTSNTWRNYMDTPKTMFSRDCFIYYDSAIYHLTNELVMIDPLTWESTVVTAVQSSLQNPERCAGVSIGGDPGIFTRTGNWLNLNTLQWEVKVMPYYDPAASVPNAMWSFRGLPTIFGMSACDGGSVCDNRDVIQYDPQTNAWVNLGAMVHSRTNHDVVEVPASYCNVL